MRDQAKIVGTAPGLSFRLTWSVDFLVESRRFMGRVRGMGLERWPRILAEALAERLGTETWADYGYKSLGKYGLLGKWKEENWTEKTWSKLVMETLKEGQKQDGQKK